MRRSTACVVQLRIAGWLLPESPDAREIRRSVDPRKLSGSWPHFRVPPWCALAGEPVDDEIAGRVVGAPDGLYRGGAVIVHAVQLHLVPGVISVDDDEAGAEVGRPWVTDAAIVDDADS